jgi:hypothetical protein
MENAARAQESLAVSGKVHATMNVHLFAEHRLAANVTTVRLRVDKRVASPS